MANKIYLNSTFGYREDTLKNWQTANTVLEKGELSFVRDGFDGKFVKIGDGHTKWNDLPFAPLPKGEKGEQGEKGIDGKDGVNGKDGADYVLTKADKEEIANMAKPEIDQTYNPESENAQSGVAVAEALATVGESEKEWQLIEDITLTEAVYSINFDADKINTFKEVHVEGYIVPTDTTITNQAVQFNNGSPVWQTNVNCKATGKFYVIMDIYKSPRNTTVYDGTISCYDYSVSGASFKITKMSANLPESEKNLLINSNQLILRTSTANYMAVGTRFKVWGR